MMAYLFLAIAIVAEVMATAALAKTANAAGWMPSLVTLFGYVIAFVCLSITLRTMPVGVAYAIWSGVGIVLISLVGALFLEQRLDTPAYIGIGLIAAGVVIVNVFSGATHL
jgi:small multidrug resistance pump